MLVIFIMFWLKTEVRSSLKIYVLHQLWELLLTAHTIHVYVNLSNILHWTQYLDVNSSNLLLLSESGSYGVISRAKDTVYGISTVSHPLCFLQFLQSLFSFHFHAFSFINMLRGSLGVLQDD